LFLTDATLERRSGLDPFWYFTTRLAVTALAYFGQGAVIGFPEQLAVAAID
jgi:hypothetical protein